MMKHKEKHQYIFTVLFTLIALAGMTAYNFFSFYSNAVSNMIAMGESSLAQETEELNGYIAKGMDVLQVTAITVEYMMQQGASPEELEAFLREESERYMAEIDPNFTGIYGLFQGNYLDGIGWEPDADYVPQEREWYIAAQKAGGRPTVVSPYLDAQTNTIMISVSQLLYDNESVISFDIVMDQIQIITQSINLDGMGYGFVIDKEGLVVAHSDEAEKGKNYQSDTQMDDLMKKVYKEGPGTYNVTVDHDNCTVFADIVSNDWYVVMIISNTRLYHDIRNILFRNIAICIVVFVLVVYFCTRAFRKIGVHMRKEEESRQNVEKLNDAILRTLARTIDAKDRYTNGHSQRVAKYAAAIAENMGKSSEEQQEIYDAALLHDVGKIHIPDAIINKPTKLTEEEFDYIKLHPVAGYCILRDIKENALTASAAKWHHERYDGKGYPDGLAGESIPEVARIVGVADAYDAMTSNRSYRQIMHQDKVRSEIENGKGRQFDPEIADIMLEMIDRDEKYEMRQRTGLTTNILAVDDEPETLDQIEALLKDEPGYVVHRASTGEEALALIKEISPDVVLVDIQMPEQDGFEVYSGIREMTEVPVVFLTEDKSVEIIEKINALGIEDYLVKPFMPQALLEILHSILQEKEGEQQ
ncbi:MAG: response regulator [Roseburia sp.]|nr:response regulator [Roseburia sp.]